MIKKIKEFLKQICEKPSPKKRLAIVIVVCLALAAIDISILLSSVRNIGKNDAQKKLMKLEHIDGIKIPKNDSINFLKQKMYEYE